MTIRRIDPIKASDHIRETYLRYLNTTFGLKESDLAAQFRERARETIGLFRGPILEATPKYKKGKSLLELITEKDSYMSTEFLNFAPGFSEQNLEECLSLSRELYLHQEKSLRKIIGENRNIVVTTGTGSGKTECFLIPIIDYLLKERASGLLGPGVRALIVYPMNALANDQVYRLRKILPPESGITFGRYTGQTLQTYYQGLEAFKQENVDQIPQPNELFCRDQILGFEPLKGDWPHKSYDPLIGPPHILLTNFAMLEYLLMRPQDTPLFDYGAGDTWRFLVLDEAHVYTGALGTEIGYLVRRVKDRICRSQKGKLICIATSATIGAFDKESKTTIAKSFENLFSENFDEEDILAGDVIPPEIFLKDIPIWGKGHQDFYYALTEIVYDEKNSISIFLENVKQKILSPISTNPISGWPNKKIVEKSIDQIRHFTDIKRAIEVFLFNILGGDERLRIIIKKLEKAPIDLRMGSKSAWSSVQSIEDALASQRSLIDLVDLASQARLETNSAPLLAARYHFFVRSLEGLSICLVQNSEGNEDWPKLLIGRHQLVSDAPGGGAVAFELRACMRCGQSFLHGYLMDDGRFVSYPQRMRLDEKMRPGTHLAINLNEVIESPEDEDPLREEKPPASSEEDQESESYPSKTSATCMDLPRYLCVRCGFISDDDSTNCKFCFQRHAKISNEWVEIRRIHPEKGGTVKVCPACGGQKHFGGSIIRAFSPGDDAAGAVLAHSLITNIPPTTEEVRREAFDDNMPKGRFATSASGEESIVSTPGKRRLLAFSDSRQDAAYFSTYLNRTADQIMHRQLILKAIKRLLRENPETISFDCNNLVNPLILEAQEVGLFSPGATEIERKTEVSKWLTAELASIQRRYGLEGVGLITWESKYRQKLVDVAKSHETGLKKDYGLNAFEFVLLLEIFLSELRKQNVLQPIYNTPIRDTYFWPRNRPYTIRRNHVHSALSIASWLPQSSRNIRSDFLERLLSRIGIDFDKGKITELLKDLWELSSINLKEIPIWEEVPSVNMLWGGKGKEGAVRRLRWDAWLGNLQSNGKNDGINKCDVCGSLTNINLKGVCPTYKCPGKLFNVNPADEFKDNHYRYLYESAPIPMAVSEHTAQITNQAGAERQREFCDDKGALNVLSCSTTFELGVDVGQLHAVFMRNVPPTVANYVQRSGRAGRRLSAAAFVLTFCRSRPHDLGYFDVTEKLITGKIQPPRVRIDNNRIARRHLHSVILSRFWRSFHPELFNGPENKRRGIVQWFFFEPPETGAKLVYDWLQKKPEDLNVEITRIFSPEIAKDLSFDSWRWAEELVRKPLEISEEVWWEGRLGIAQSELKSEYNEYNKLQKEKPKLYNLAEAQKRRIRERQILDFLASRNVLPKYGFPVDVVSLKIQSTDEWAQKIELDRDLRIALSEYAPGCTLVANGKVIKSYALEKIPGKAWPEYQFAICRNCGKFHRSEIAEGDIDFNCECGQSLQSTDNTILHGTFIEPSYGFRTHLNEDGQVPVEVRPQRTFSTRVYFSHYSWAEEEPFLNEGVPDKVAGIQIQKRYSRYGVLVVLNPGRLERGFWLCPFCGYGDAVAGGIPKSHKTPWGSPCKGRLRQVYLGHEFQGDVLELQFHGPALDKSDHGFWLSITAAFLAGAAKALDIERDDIDGTVLQFAGEGYRSIVLFDNVPGGAGHVRRISIDLQKVMEAAFTIADNCPSCSRDQSCNTCLRNFRNQYDHDLLKRGPVADALSKILSSLYRKDEDGFFPVGLTDRGRWLEQLIRRSNHLDLIVDDITMLSNGQQGRKEWYSVIHDLVSKGSEVRLFFTENLKRLRDLGTGGKFTLYSLSAFSQSPYIEIFSIPKNIKLNINAYIGLRDEKYVVRWPKGKNPFAESVDIELSALNNYTVKMKAALENLIERKDTSKWDLQKLHELLQGAKVVQIPAGMQISWKDILVSHLPESIKEVEIYDRFIRNIYQFKSLEMFLDALYQKISKEGMSVQIRTTASERYENIERDFKNLQTDYGKKAMRIHYNILEPSKTLPHFRRILIKSKEGEHLIWLDRGLDIYRFDDLKNLNFITLNSYIVIETKSRSFQ